MKNSESSVAVLASGGLDSSILLVEFAEKGFSVVPIFIKSGFFWESIELRWLQRFLKAVEKTKIGNIVELEVSMEGLIGEGHWAKSTATIPDGQSDDSAVYIPGRNLILLSQSAIYAGVHGIGTVALATLKGNPFSDATEEFFKSMAHCSSLALNKPIEILAPFRFRTKSEIIEQYSTLPLHLTFSCLKPMNDQHCGTCNKCAERIHAFQKAGIPDRTEYVNEP